MTSTRRGRDWLARVTLALLAGAPLMALWPGSPLGRFLPPEVGVPGVTAGWVLAVVVSVLALVVTLRPASTLAWSMPVIAGALVVLLYPYARLDWSRLLKDWALVGGGFPWPVALALAALALASAWGLHVVTLRRALVDRCIAKGVPAEEATRAGRGVASAGRAAGGTALGAVAVLGLAHALGGPVGAALTARLSGASFLVPLLAAGLVAIALGFFLARREPA